MGLEESGPIIFDIFRYRNTSFNEDRKGLSERRQKMVLKIYLPDDVYFSPT